jgi:hypothetical protein
MNFFIGSSEAMRINTAGNVGIGMAPTQSAKLAVSGTVSTTGDIVLTSNARYIYTRHTNNTLTRSFGLNVSNNLYIGSVDQPITGILFNNNGSDQMYILANGNVGIGTMGPNSKLHVRNAVVNASVIDADGVSGELFGVTDTLTGSLFSVNDISGIPVLEAFSDNTIVLGDYQAPALYTTTKAIRAQNITNSTIYQLSATSYTSAFFDYNVTSGTNSRTGTIMAVWNSLGTLEHNEVSTLDVGNTLGTRAITFDVVVSGVNVLLRSTTSPTGGTWTIKVIVRAI